MLASLVVVSVMVVAVPGGAFADEAEPPSTTTASTTTPPTTTPPTAPTTEPATDPTVPPATDPATDPPADAPADPPTTVPDVPGAPTTEPPTAQLTPMLTVTPSTGLANRETVTVAGSGFTPDTAVGWAECKAGGGGAADCDVQVYGTAQTDGTGAFSAPFVVHRILHTQNGIVDSASAVDACWVGAAKLSDYGENANAFLDFDPSIPLPPPPTLLAGPATGLVEGQSIALFGGGFPGNTSVSFLQCVTGTTICSQLGGTSANGNGDFITITHVHRAVVQPPFSNTDCASAPGACSLVAVAASDRDAQNFVALSFDPSGPPPAGSLIVTPHTDLVQYQTVSVAGSGFPSGAGVQILECTSAPVTFNDCSPYSVGFAPVAANGSFSTSVTLGRVLHLSGGDVDCASAPGACSLFASSYGALPVVAAAALDFDTSVPLPPPPTIAVAPDTDLVQGQQLTVTGSDFAPNTPVVIYESATSDPVGSGCGGGSGAYVTTDGTGGFTTPFAAQRGIRDYTNFPPGALDCASAPQACSVVAYAFNTGDSATAPVSFDPTVPVVPPTVTVTPQFGLADRTLVSVHGTGFTPGDQVLISQCDVDAVSYGPGCSPGASSVYLSADPSGAVDASLRVRRDLSYYDDSRGGPPIVTANCSDAVGECVIRAESYSDPLASVDVPLGFDPSTVAPPPVITTTPAGPWADGQQVVVHGSGFTPNARLGLAGCIAGVDPTGRTCDATSHDSGSGTGAGVTAAADVGVTTTERPGGLYDEFHADGNGEFARTITIHRQFETTEATVDCTTEPSGCVLFAANREDYGFERATVAIVFDSTVIVAHALAFTGAGSSTEPLAIAGAGAVALGLALLLLTRRRAAEGRRATS